jgi:hypothetical protein
MDRINKAVKWLWNNYTKLLPIIGWAMSFALPAWAAHAVGLFRSWAPLSWVIAGFAGAGFFVMCYLGFALARKIIVRSQVEKTYRDRLDGIDPMADRFVRQRIKLLDLASPIDGTITGKTFEDCELIGPANIVIMSSAPGRGGFDTVNFIDAAAVLVREDAMIANCIVLQDCIVRRCKVHRVTMFMPVSAYQFMVDKLPGMNLLTPTPEAQPST